MATKKADAGTAFNPAAQEDLGTGTGQEERANWDAYLCGFTKTPEPQDGAVKTGATNFPSAMEKNDEPPEPGL